MWYSISCPDRILQWRSWRQELDNLEIGPALDLVAKTWMMVPRVNHYLAPDLFDSWPNPWELINDNIYCDLAVALGMFYSLQLSKHSAHHEFDLMTLRDSSGWIHLCRIDHGLSVLNWWEGKIVNTPTLPPGTEIIHHYNKVDLASKLG